MSDPDAPDANPPDANPPGANPPAASPIPWRTLVWPLAFAEVAVWAAFFYSFPALLPYWTAEFGWSKTELAGAFTLALVVSGLTAPLMGRVIDAGWGRAAMAAASVLGAVLISAMALVETRAAFYALWAGIGACMAGTMYEPCFAVVTRLLGTNARRAITAITLVAGLAGTVSFPLGYAMAEAFGWRAALVAYGALALGVGTPLLLFAGRGMAPADDTDTEALRHAPAAASAKPLGVLRRPAFWLLAVTFSMMALEHGMIITHLLPLLADRGIGAEAAAVAAAMIGPMQVAGRLAMLSVENRVSMVAIAWAGFAGLAVAALALFGAVAVPMLVVAFVVFQGSGNGVTSIARPTVTAQLLGRANFGRISGALAMPFMGSIAAAPTVAALIWQWGGYDAVLCVAVAACALGAGSLWLAVRSALKVAKPVARKETR